MILLITYLIDLMPNYGGVQLRVAFASSLVHNVDKFFQNHSSETLIAFMGSQ